jgi:hypothetical protein
LKKTEITLSDVCSSCQSLCAKWFGRVFKNEFLRHAHNTYHVTALLQTSERKNNGLESLKNHCRVKYTCDPLGVLSVTPLYESDAGVEREPKTPYFLL